MNRKIMVEVTPQELEKIQAGKLNSEDIDIDELVDMLILKASSGRYRENSHFDVQECRYVDVTEHIFIINTNKYGEVRLSVDEKQKLPR